MVMNVNQLAAAAYGATQKLPVLGGSASKAEGGSFADFLEQGLEKFSDIQKKSEEMTSAAALGTADINDVILAVQNADVALSAVTAIRDRIISAYQDILRMAI